MNPFVNVVHLLLELILLTGIQKKSSQGKFSGKRAKKENVPG